MAFTNFLAAELLDHVLKGATYTPPADIFISLYTTSPNEAGTGGTEVSGGSYARLEIDDSTRAFVAATSADPSLSTNNEKWTWPTATANWGDITHIGVCDALTSGNILMVVALDATKTVDSGDTFSIDTGDLDITLD